MEVDNKVSKKRIKEAGEEVIASLEILLRTLKSILDGEFSVEHCVRIKAQCLLTDRSSRRKQRERKTTQSEPAEHIESTVNEELRAELQEWRTARYKADNIPAYTIIHQSTLIEIASIIPKTQEDLLKIKGFGKAKFAKYGAEILEITSKY